MGLRVPVGVDYRGRRYWLLGGVSGAWRLYCEEKDGELWVSCMYCCNMVRLLLLLLLLLDAVVWCGVGLQCIIPAQVATLPEV
jgi:hypothetical protein